MERTISSIFEIEEKAASIINRANEEKLRLRKEHETDVEKMEQEISNDNNTRINEFRSRINRELEDELKQLSVKCEKQQQELKEAYAKNHEGIAQAIYKEIIML